MTAVHDYFHLCGHCKHVSLNLAGGDYCCQLAIRNYRLEPDVEYPWELRRLDPCRAESVARVTGHTIDESWRTVGETDYATGTLVFDDETETSLCDE